MFRRWCETRYENTDHDGVHIVRPRLLCRCLPGLTVTPQITSRERSSSTWNVENTCRFWPRRHCRNPALISQQAHASPGDRCGTVVIGGVIQTQNSLAIRRCSTGRYSVPGQPVKHRTVSTSDSELIFSHSGIIQTLVLSEARSRTTHSRGHLENCRETGRLLSSLIGSSQIFWKIVRELQTLCHRIELDFDFLRPASRFLLHFSLWITLVADRLRSGLEENDLDVTAW